MANMVFYCDLENYFKDDFPINGKILGAGESIDFIWRILAPEKNRYRIQWEWTVNRTCKLTVNGRSFAHHHDFFPQTYDDLELELVKGENELFCRLTNAGKTAETINCRMRLLDLRGFPMPCDFDSYREGIGAAIKSAGRFGFSKGDGILDCAMPSFGILTRPGVFGFPQYKSCNIWQLSLLPPGIETRGEIEWQYECTKNEKLKVNWSGVEWECKVKAECDYFSRRADDEVTIRFSYSLLTPFILEETNDAAFHITSEHYTKAVLWLESGVTVRESRNGVFYDRKKDGLLAANRILFFHNDSSFPEIPLMVVLQESPLVSSQI